MSPSSVRPRFRRVRFPRVSGDEPLQGTPKKPVTGFSPRERG